MAETNFENATLKLLIEDEDGIVTVASLQQTSASSSGIGGSIANKQIAFGDLTDIAGNAQFIFDASSDFFSIFLGSLELDWDANSSEATITANGNPVILKGQSIGLTNGQSAVSNTGLIRLQKTCAIKARNHAGDGDIPVLGFGVDGNNNITLGDSSSAYVLVSPLGPSILIGSTGDINLQPTGAVNISTFLALTPSDDPPADPVEGMIYADTDHHLYYYNGTTWKQLDN